MTRIRRTYIVLLALAVIAAATAVAGAQPDAPDDEIIEEETLDDDDSTGDAPPAAPVAPPADVIDVDALRQEYLRLRDALFQSRARAATVASAMYSTRLRIQLDWTEPRMYTVTRATVRLDGASVYDDTSGAIGKDKAPRFEGFVAPGRHVVAIRIESVGKDDERFVSTIENTFTVQAPPGKDVLIIARAKDGGDIPWAWQRKERGSYKLHLDVDVKTEKRSDGKRE